MSRGQRAQAAVRSPPGRPDRLIHRAGSSRVSTHDPVTFIAVPLILAVVAIAASYVPARRATQISPLEALRPS